MDKELMDKMNEALKANGKRELSLDDMDKVSGGVDGVTASNGKYFTKKELLEFARDLTQTVGYDVAGKMICEMFGLAPNEPKKQCCSDNVERMNGLINRIFSIISSGGGY